jgi:hypothetical protein
MISKSDILALVRNVTKAQAGTIARPRFVNPKREWFWIVSVTTVMFIGMTGVLFVQSQILNKSRQAETIPNKVVTYDERAAASVIAQFAARMQEQEMYEAALMSNQGNVTAATTTESVAERATVNSTSTESVPASTSRDGGEEVLLSS